MEKMSLLKYCPHSDFINGCNFDKWELLEVHSLCGCHQFVKFFTAFFTVSLTSIINPELSGKGASLLAFLRVYLKSHYFHSLFSTVRDILSARSGKKYDSYDTLKV